MAETAAAKAKTIESPKGDQKDVKQEEDKQVVTSDMK